MSRHIVYNAIQTPDGTILESFSRNDYKSHIDTITKKRYAVDGGNSYQRLICGDDKYKNLILYSDSPFLEIRKHLKRYNKYSAEYVTLDSMSDEWLDNILDYYSVSDKNLIEEFPFVYYIKEIEYRKINNIKV